MTTLIHIASIVLVISSGVWILVTDRFRNLSVHVAVLIVGIVGGIATAISGFYLIENWAVLMEHVDFTEIVRTSPRKLPSNIYFFQASTTVFGAVAAFVFARKLYVALRELRRW